MSVVLQVCHVMVMWKVEWFHLSCRCDGGGWSNCESYPAGVSCDGDTYPAGVFSCDVM